MATITTLQTALTPLASTHGPERWDYSVSGHIDNQDYDRRDSYEDYIYDNDNDNDNQVNSRGLPLRDISNHSLSNSRLPQHDHTYPLPPRLTELNHKTSNIGSTGTPDSLLDFYGQESGGIGEMVYTEEQEAHDVETDQERWIHRDKLAQIESKELQAAGFIVNTGRPRTANKQKRDASQDRLTVNTGRSESRQRARPRAPHDANANDENAEWESRSAEEAVSAHNDGSMSKGSSRIPLSKNSRVPIPLDYISRDTPVARRKSNAWNGEEDSITYSRTRDRSRSTTRMMDDSAVIDETSTAKTTVQPSPPKTTHSRNITSPSKPKPSQVVTKKRAVSGVKDLSRQQNGGRDTGASGHATTGASTNSNKRPEGDPPWLATMYKPDPRLPPDQQMLPTHAKRLQQEAWEKEGKFGNAYDSSFRPINNESPAHSTRDPSPDPNSLGVKRDAEPILAEPKKLDEWPLQSSQISSPSGRPSPPTGGGGSYSTMPRIQTQVTSPTSPPITTSPRATNEAPIATSQVMRMSDTAKMEPEKVKNKKGCGCCVVM